MAVRSQSINFGALPASTFTGLVTIKPSVVPATCLLVGTSAADNGSDYCGIFVDQTNLSNLRFGIGIGCVQRYTPLIQPAANQALTTCYDGWNIAGANLLGPASITIDEHNCGSFQVSFFADTGKTGNFSLARAIKITAPTLLGTGTKVINAVYGMDIESMLGVTPTNTAAIRLRAQNFIKSQNNAAANDRSMIGMDSSDNVVVGDVNVATLLSGSVIVNGAAQAEALSTLTYSASMTPSALAGNEIVISPTNGTAFTINAPTIPISGMFTTYVIRNISGGALGAVTWDPVFKLAAWTQPANGNSRSIVFRYNGTNWVERFRTPADVPN